MEKTKIITYSLVHALAILVYIVAVVYGLQNGERFFGVLPEMFAAIPVLLTLVFSVGLMAVLVFGRPVYLFMTGLKREGVEFLLYTLGWLFVVILLILAYMTQIPSDPYQYPMVDGSTQVDY